MTDNPRFPELSELSPEDITILDEPTPTTLEQVEAGKAYSRPKAQFVRWYCGSCGYYQDGRESAFPLMPITFLDHLKADDWHCFRRGGAEIELVEED